MNKLLRVPCAYQGGKQRIASQVVDLLLEAAPGKNSIFYDLCCGSGAVSIELVNRGVEPSRIYMLDISSWGEFWSAIGSNTFDIDVFDQILSELPNDKREFKNHMLALSALPTVNNEAEIYPVLQASSFGGKQIWNNGGKWKNACFRDYWEPTATSVRRSPANPMQPSPEELRRRVHALVDGMRGVNGFKMDIMDFLKQGIARDAVVYVDPPYQSTTGYAFGFDIKMFIKRFVEVNKTPLFISEGLPLHDNSYPIVFGGAKGGISGNKTGKHKEWVTRF